MNGGWCPIEPADDKYYEYGGHNDKSGESVDGGKKCKCLFGFTGERCESTFSDSIAFFVWKKMLIFILAFVTSITPYLVLSIRAPSS